MLSGDVKLSVSIFRGHKKKLLSLCVNKGLCKNRENISHKAHRGHKEY
jgi:hypothetical protein